VGFADIDNEMRRHFGQHSTSDRSLNDWYGRIGIQITGGKTLTDIAMCEEGWNKEVRPIASWLNNNYTVVFWSEQRMMEHPQCFLTQQEDSSRSVATGVTQTAGTLAAGPTYAQLSALAGSVDRSYYQTDAFIASPSVESFLRSQVDTTGRPL
jgi:hypothetical protein